MQGQTPSTRIRAALFKPGGKQEPGRPQGPRSGAPAGARPLAVGAPGVPYSAKTRSMRAAMSARRSASPPETSAAAQPS